MKNNRKGFTTVELVIVIAVIAILAAVLIPTFSNLVKKANESTALQATRAALTVVLTEENAQLDTTAYDYYFIYQDGTNTAVWYKYDSGKLVKQATAPTAVTDTGDKLYDLNTSTASAITNTANITVITNSDLDANVTVWLDKKAG